MSLMSHRRLAAVMLLLLLASSAHASIVVTTTGDADNPSDGVCSFREAVEAVNAGAQVNECTDKDGASAGLYDFIIFNIPDPGVHTIALQTALPEISKRILIDATPQATGCTPVPRVGVEITNGNALTGDGLVLLAGSDYSIIGGLAISGFSGGAGLRVESNYADIGCNVIGTDPTGATAQPNLFGVRIAGFYDHVGDASADSWLPNLISGNSDTNVLLDSSAVSAYIAGNYIGVDSSGLVPLPSNYGILVQGSGAHIGFNAEGGPAAHARNVIGVTGPAPTVDILLGGAGASDTVIAGNHIGVGADGQTVLPAHAGSRAISAYPTTNTVIGCDGTASWDACRNVIASAGGTAIATGDGNSGMAIVSNFIGVAADGITLIGSGQGILMTGGDALVARNVIRTGSVGIELDPNGANVTAVFLNQATAGTNGATLYSSDNCVTGNPGGGVYTYTAGGTIFPLPATFAGNWWGAADGPAGSNAGSGDFASDNVIVSPFLNMPSVYCGFDTVFRNGFE